MSNDPFGLQPQGPSSTRLLVAVALTTALMMGYSHFFGGAQQNASKVPVVVESPAEAAVSSSFGFSADASLDFNAGSQKSFFVDVNKKLTDENAGLVRGGYTAAVGSVGGQVSSFVLTGYKPEVNLAQPLKNGIALFGLTSRDSSMALPLNAAYELTQQGEFAATLRYESTDNVTVIRRYTFDEDNFSLRHEIEIINNTDNSRAIALDIAMAEGKLSPQKSGFLSPSPSDFGVVCHHDGKKERLTFDELKEKPKVFSGGIEYVGFDKQYFLVALVPDVGPKIRTVEVHVSGSEKDENGYGVTLLMQQEPFVLAAHERKTMSFVAFIGPKQVGLLSSFGKGLEDSVNFGWFGVISRPLLWLLNQLYALIGNFGMAIVLLTLIIKALTFPLTQKSFVNMQEMKKYQPDIKALTKKYAHDKTQLGQKQMEFYKEKGINPMSGCLPHLVQMPVWFALYQMLSNSVELYQQPFWLWIVNLTAPDPYYVFPVLMGVSMFVQTMFQPVPEDQPQMKYVMYGMPFFLTFIMLKMPAGLALYMFVNNILTILQQLFIKRKYAGNA